MGYPTSSPDTESAGATKRLTIDVSVELHRKLKVRAAEEGVRMADLVRQWIQHNL
ncbi:MAG: hypothetical protein GY906_39350 [bacterium]|nr:hypothetical protein [bacterium]